MGHIELSRSADLIVVAPATADLMAKAAAGLADDLASTTLLATDKPVLMAPAMNVRMWEHPATRRNLATLKARRRAFRRAGRGADGLRRVRPRPHGRAGRRSSRRSAPRWTRARRAAGGQAGAGHRRPHRRADRSGARADQPLERQAGLRHRRRAGAAGRRGDPGLRPDRPRRAAAASRRVEVETAREMLAASLAALPADAAVCVAAVADWRADEALAVKLKKGKDGPPPLRLVENPDILATLAAAGPEPAEAGGRLRRRDRRCGGATRAPSSPRKGCDWIVANDVQPGRGDGRRRERGACWSTPQGVDAWPRASKAEVAAQARAGASPRSFELPRPTRSPSSGLPTPGPAAARL